MIVIHIPEVRNGKKKGKYMVKKGRKWELVNTSADNNTKSIKKVRKNA